MSIPNRLKEVKEIVKKYPQVFEGPDSTLDNRRRLLIPIVARELNKLDNNNWRLLNRLDRQDDDPKPGRLTSDVIVWFPTKEHVDVLSGSGAMWGEHGVITDPDWKLETWDKWPTWDDLDEPPVTPPVEPPAPPVDPPTPPVDLTPILRRLQVLEVSLTALGAVVDSLIDRVIRLEAKPEFKLPELIAEGSTSRTWGHGHTVNLTVKVKE